MNILKDKTGSVGYIAKCVVMFAGICFLATIAHSTAYASENSRRPERELRFNGYLKEMPSLDFNNIVSGAGFDNIVHNRMNFRYIHNSNVQFVFEFRNRLISGSMVSDYHDFLMESFKNDPGLINASLVPASGRHHIWHLNADRFFADWRGNNWQIRLGRQRINWGINMVSNPNDLFNTYSFFDFDYEERPGADALRVQYYTGDLSRIELAVSPAPERNQSVAAVMYAFNNQGFDIQLMAGYYKHRTAIGGGWATSIGESGFKGEISLFNSIGQMDSATVVASVSLDHLFGNNMYGFVEALYNGGYQSNQGFLLLMNEPMRADNIFISKYAVTGSLNYPVSPIISASASAMYIPDLKGYYLMPSLAWSAATNFDINLLAQFFRLKYDTMALHSFRPYLQMKWSF